MGYSQFSFIRGLTIAGFLSLIPFSAEAVEHEVQILLDLDNNPATGCTVATVEGPFDGVEQILITAVETSSPPPAGTVTDVAISDCVDPGTDTFSAPASFDGGWPAGIDNGAGGRDVVETYVSLLALAVQNPSLVRLGVVVTDEFGGEQALFTVDDAPGGAPILLDLSQSASSLVIPALGHGGLILLALLLSAAAFYLMRRHGGAALGLALLILATEVAWAAVVLDGQTDDWSAGDQLASNGLVLFGKGEGGQVGFRVDVALLFNTPPEAVNDSFTGIAEDSSANPLDVLTNDTDPGDSFTITAVGVTSDGGTVMIVGGGASLEYTPAADFSGTETFTYTITDSSGGTDTATVSVTVAGSNDAPLADAQSVTTSEETSVQITLTGSDVDGDTLSFAIATNPANGTLSGFDPNTGAVTYTPNGDFNGADSFTFTVNDGTTTSAPATVSVTVDPANDAPVADAQSVTTGEDTPVLITLTGSDVDGDALTFAIATNPANGTLSGFDPNTGAVTYTPNGNFNGTDSFTFTVNDGTATSPAATVSITVAPANDAPLANAQSVTTNEDTPVVITLTGSDVDGDPLTFAIGTGPANGSLSAITPVDATSAQVTYTPNANFTGADSFTFTVNDGMATSAPATVSISVTAGNDPALVDLDADDSGGIPGNDFAFTYAENAGAVALLDPADATITDIDSATLTQVTLTLTNLLDASQEFIAADATGFPNITVQPFDTTTTPGEGVLVISAATPQPIADFVGVLRTATYQHTGNDPDTTDRVIQVTANDGGGDGPAATSTATITAGNDAPVADAQSVTTDEDTPVVITLTGSDVDGDALTFAIDTGPANGTLSAISPIDATSAQVTYTPNSDFNGADSFTFTVNDGTTTSPPATVSLTVSPLNDVPVANAQSVTTNEDSPVVITLTGSDVDGDPLTFAIDTGPANGALSAITPVDATSAQVTYTPNANFTGADSFTFTVNDGTTTSTPATVSITVNPVDDPPAAVADAATVDEDSGANTIDVLANDPDIDGGPIQIQSVTQPANGTVVITNGGADLTYEPDLNYCNGGTPTDDFTYTLNGGSVATVSVSVTCINDPPVAGADAFDFIGNTELRVDLAASATPHALETTVSGLGALDNDTDPVEGDPIFVAGIVGCADATAPFDCALPGVGTVSMTAGGQFSFVPEAGDADASEAFQYTLSDGTDTAVGTVTLARFERVWYVKNDAAAGGTGTSIAPFDTLAEAETASAANETLFVHFGDGTSAGQDAGIDLKDGQRLLGEHVGLSVPVDINGNGSPTLLFAAVPGNRSVIGDTVAGAPEGVSAIDVVPAEVAGLSLSGNAHAILWRTVAPFPGTGTFRVHDNVVTGAAGFGVNVVLDGTSAVRLAFHDNDLTATGAALFVLGPGGPGTLTITAFDDNTVSGATGGSGIVIATAIFDADPVAAGFQTVNGGATAVGASGNGVGGSGVDMGGVSGDLLFTDLDVFADGGTGLQVVGVGPFTLGGGMRFRIGAGVGSVSAIGGPAVALTNLTADLQLASVSSTNTTTQGVSLNGVADGGGTSAVFTAAAGSLTATLGATGPIFELNGGNAQVNYAGTITNTGAGRAVSIQNWNGDDGADSIELSGAIVEQGTGILVNNNSGSGAITFSGGMDIDTTTGEGFVSTNNGMADGLNVTGTNTIVSTSATALRVENTIIGSSDLNFQSISSGNTTGAADPVSGIVLNNAGDDGEVVVTGTGGTCTSAATCTGGAIQNTTGDGVSLISTRAPSLTGMFIGGSGRHGIHATSLSNGLTLASSFVQNSGNADNEYGLNMSNVAGTVAISGTTFNNAADDLVHYVNLNTNGTLTVTGANSFVYPAVVGGTANAAIALQPNGTSNLTATIQGNTFTNIVSSSIQWVPSTAGSNGTSTLDFSNNTITVNMAGRGSGFALSCQESTTGNVTIANNVFTGAGGNGVISIDCNDSSLLTGTVSGNSITNPPGIGMFLAVDEAAEARLALTGNTVTNSGGDGMQVVNFGGVGVSNLFLAITNNQVNGHSGNTAVNFVGGISVTSFEDNACIELRGNTVTGTPTGATQCGGAPCVDYYVEEVGGTMSVEEVPNTGDTTLTAAYVNATNDAGPVTIFGVIDLTNGAQCPFP